MDKVFMLTKRKSLLGWSAASILLLAQGAWAQQEEATTTDQEAEQIELENIDFEEIDRNNNGRVEPEELNRRFDNQLSELGWDERRVFDDYDQDQNEALDEMEYNAFTRGFVERQEFVAAEIDEDAAQDVPAEAQGEAPNAGERVEALVRVTPVREVAVDELVDRELVNLDGEKVGTVEEVVRRQDGQQQGLVVSSGGFFGLGGRSVVVDADEVVVSEDQLVWERTSDEDGLDDLPEYNQEDYVSAQ